MRILVACEYSGIVRRAFSKLGHEVVSADFEMAEDFSEHHYIGDCFDLIDRMHFDMMIAFPPCTFLCSSGMHWTTRGLRPMQKTTDALDFVRRLMVAPIAKIAIENPVGKISTAIRKPDQIIQPYWFGEDASKKTCLWLKNLPLLTTVNYISPRIIDGRERWGNQTDSGQNKLPPSAERWKDRARTYPGVAEAMARQWGT